MSNPLRTIEDYELFLYTLKEQFKSIRHSTLILTRRGASLARVSGELQNGLCIIFIDTLLPLPYTDDNKSNDINILKRGRHES